LPSRALGTGGAAGAGLAAGVDRVADPPLEGAACFFAGLAFGQLLAEARPSLPGWRIWVTPAMWIAWLSRRFPRRDSR
jgi:hypothetical protein